MQVMILGASVRSAAASARRAGLRPIGIDLFADRDLAALGPAVAIPPSSYPAGLVDAAEEAPPAPWFYTGSLENHPELIDLLASRRPLWGVSGEVLRAVRDPFALAEVLRDSGFAYVEARRDPGTVPRDGSWLVKPLASAGGREIRPWTPDALPASEPVYYQRRIPGPSHSALFLGRDGGAVDLIGVTAQWLGRPGAPFTYRGSIGPIRFDGEGRSQIATLGRVLAGAFRLRGLFGVDLVWHDDRAWPVEINPRYPASAEVLEWTTGRSLIDEHRRLFEPGATAPPPPGPAGRPAAFGKVVVYAPVPGRAPALEGWRPFAENGRWPRFADIPRPGTPLRAGDPVLTLLQAGPSPEACRARLERRLARWQQRLRRPPWSIPGASDTRELDGWTPSSSG